jgi:hypothetical protein
MGETVRIRSAVALLICLVVPHWARAQVTVEKPWIRATAPGQTVAAGYLEIRSERAAMLVGASSPAAKRSEIHEMIMEQGVMKMRAVPSLPLPAGKTVELKPGGCHIMLVDIAKPLRSGEVVPISLVIETGKGQRQVVDIRAAVREITAQAEHSGRH